MKGRIDPAVAGKFLKPIKKEKFFFLRAAAVAARSYTLRLINNAMPANNGKNSNKREKST